MNSFIVVFLAKFFSFLRWISVFQIISWLFTSLNKSYIFVEIWVISNFTLSIISLILVTFFPDSFIIVILICYGFTRIFEIVIYLANVLLFDEYRPDNKKTTYAIKGIHRTFILVLHNYIETMVWFALFYCHFHNSFKNGVTIFPDALGYSFYIITTFGFSNIEPIDRLSYSIVFTEAAIGVFMVVIIIARFISLFPSPKILDEISEKQS